MIDFDKPDLPEFVEMIADEVRLINQKLAGEIRERHTLTNELSNFIDRANDRFSRLEDKVESLGGLLNGDLDDDGRFVKEGFESRLNNLEARLELIIQKLAELQNES